MTSRELSMSRPLKAMDPCRTGCGGQKVVDPKALGLERAVVAGWPALTGSSGRHAHSLLIHEASMGPKNYGPSQMKGLTSG